MVSGSIKRLFLIDHGNIYLFSIFFSIDLKSINRLEKYVVTPHYLYRDSLTLINEPTYISENSSSCIDLIFTSQPNLVVEWCAYPILHPNCHYQISFTKFSLMIFYPSPFPEKSGIIKKQMLTLSEEQLVSPIAKKPSITLITVQKMKFSIKDYPVNMTKSAGNFLPRKYLFSIKQF